MPTSVFVAAGASAATAAGLATFATIVGKTLLAVAVSKCGARKPRRAP